MFHGRVVRAGQSSVTPVMTSGSGPRDGFGGLLRYVWNAWKGSLGMRLTGFFTGGVNGSAVEKDGERSQPCGRRGSSLSLSFFDCGAKPSSPGVVQLNGAVGASPLFST